MTKCVFGASTITSTSRATLFAWLTNVTLMPSLSVPADDGRLMSVGAGEYVDPGALLRSRSDASGLHVSIVTGGGTVDCAALGTTPLTLATMASATIVTPARRLLLRSINSKPPT